MAASHQGNGIPLEQYMRRSRRRRVWIAVVSTTLFVSAVVLDQSGRLLFPGSDVNVYDGRTFVVSRVVDGDTLHIEEPDGDRSTTAIQLWGVDAPELKRSDGETLLAAQPFGDEAKRFVESLCLGKDVGILVERHRTRDHAGRLLAHVRLTDGRSLNERLLIDGLAQVEDGESHSRIERYRNLQRDARLGKTGIWSR